MVQRAMNFIDLYGPIILDGLTFEGGYTQTVMTGDGDYMTADTIWDFKVSKRPVQKEHTLQLLMYWRMGLHSIHPEYKNIKYLGIYNPRIDKAYRLSPLEIPADVIMKVESDVIGYHYL